LQKVHGSGRDRSRGGAKKDLRTLCAKNKESFQQTQPEGGKKTAGDHTSKGTFRRGGPGWATEIKEKNTPKRGKEKTGPCEHRKVHQGVGRSRATTKPGREPKNSQIVERRGGYQLDGLPKKGKKTVKGWR